MVDWEKIDQVYMPIVEQCEKTEKIMSETHFLSKPMDEEVDKALMKLPEEYRTAIILVDIEDLSYQEAAKVVGCPVGTVRSRVSKGRRIMLVELRNYTLEKGLISE
jgi:RNA polymerase sigma-70 factor (ECF subfamily)